MAIKVYQGMIDYMNESNNNESQDNGSEEGNSSIGSSVKTNSLSYSGSYAEDFKYEKVDHSPQRSEVYEPQYPEDNTDDFAPDYSAYYDTSEISKGDDFAPDYSAYDYNRYDYTNDYSEEESIGGRTR